MHQKIQNSKVFSIWLHLFAFDDKHVYSTDLADMCMDVQSASLYAPNCMCSSSRQASHDSRKHAMHTLSTGQHVVHMTILARVYWLLKPARSEMNSAK